MIFFRKIAIEEKNQSRAAGRVIVLAGVHTLFLGYQLRYTK